MFHKFRRHSVTDVGSLAELAIHLYEHTWTLCSAFRCGRIVAANDSTGPDGAQEYAIFVDGRQVESFTVSWMDSAQDLEEHLRRVELNASSLETINERPLFPHPEGACHLCA